MCVPQRQTETPVYGRWRKSSIIKVKTKVQNSKLATGRPVQDTKFRIQG
jgi:hypothetical protein